MVRIVTNGIRKTRRRRQDGTATKDRRYPGNCMKHFSVRQKWVARDPIFGTFFGEVTEVSDDGKSGIVVITDDRGNVLDTFSGSAADFQTSGEWQLADQSPPAATHPPPHPKD